MFLTVYSSWLLKFFSDTIQKRSILTKLRSTRVVTDGCYGMLKWRIHYKKTGMKKKNLMYFVMSCIIPHNLFIHHYNPCNSILDVGYVSFKNTITNRNESKNELIEVSKRIAD